MLRLPKVLLLVMPLVAGLALLPGCGGDTYSDAVQFTVRTDPILPTELLADESASGDPDTPGQLPLLNVAQVAMIENLLVPPRAPEDEKKKVIETVERKLRDPTRISDTDRRRFEDTLNAIFGSPAHPQIKLPEGTGKDARAALDKAAKALHLDEDTLALGSKYYRLHCMACHGVTGDGRGPTAAWLNPHPRDYRLGEFKFQSRNQAGEVALYKPSREDLLRTLRRGVEGTAMPSFDLLSEKDLNALVSYVILLSIRGEAELSTFRLMDENPNTRELTVSKTKMEGGIKKTLQNKVVFLAQKWEEAQDKGIEVKENPFTGDNEAKSVRRGYALFLGDAKKIGELYKVSEDQTKALSNLNCQGCHKDFGRQAAFKFDKWGTLTRPANLTTGVYRGGHRPVDLYYRIHSGINGSGMLPFGGILSPEQIWDVINFVRVVPYPGMRQKHEIRID
jgi:mono/diheme cytochrome c family protein